MGNNLYPPDIANPKGYFEDFEINNINEELLSQVVLKRPSGPIGNLFFRSRLVHGQRWLAKVPLGMSIPCPFYLAKRIDAITKYEPFCFKDPRFCYTLHSWHPFIKNTTFICVFRHPEATANSLVKEAKRDSDIRNIKLHFDFKQALQLWELMYRHILEIHYPQGGEWLFLHYNQFLDGSAFDKIEKKIGVAVDREFVDSKLNRSKVMTNFISSTILLSLYQKLCNLAEYEIS